MFPTFQELIDGSRVEYETRYGALAPDKRDLFSRACAAAMQEISTQALTQGLADWIYSGLESAVISAFVNLLVELVAKRLNLSWWQKFALKTFLKIVILLLIASLMSQHRQYRARQAALASYSLTLNDSVSVFSGQVQVWGTEAAALGC